MKWRIYYGDGSTWDEDDGPLTRAPKTNVQCIVTPNEAVGRMVLWGPGNAPGFGGYFWQDEHGEWYAGDIVGALDYLMQPGPRMLFFGRSLPNVAFQAIFARAVADPDFPVKSGWRKTERPAWWPER